MLKHRHGRSKWSDWSGFGQTSFHVRFEIVHVQIINNQQKTIIKSTTKHFKNEQRSRDAAAKKELIQVE